VLDICLEALQIDTPSCAVVSPVYVILLMENVFWLEEDQSLFAFMKYLNSC